MLVQFLLLVLPRGKPWRLEVTARTCHFSLKSQRGDCSDLKSQRETEDLGEAGTEGITGDCGGGMMSVCLKGSYFCSWFRERENYVCDQGAC